MSVFNAPHFLRHIGMPTLREFVEEHVLGKYLIIDWQQDEAGLPAAVNDAVEALGERLEHEANEQLREDITEALGYWYDDLRRCHLLANELAEQEFRTRCWSDDEARAAFTDRDGREKAMWMFSFRNDAFRQVELHLAFAAKTNGRYWKKHRIDAGIDPLANRAALEAFGQAVAGLYERTGAGKATHVEVSKRDGQVQITLYVEGPVTAWAHFSQQSFSRITTRIALETALLYEPQTGVVETVVKGGAKYHKEVLRLFGTHVAGRELAPEEVQPQHYRLNALRDDLEPFEDWERYGVRKVRLRRACFSPKSSPGERVQFEALPDETMPDAISLARQRLLSSHSFESEYDLVGATLMVYPLEKIRGGRFSFDVKASGSSTIKNLQPKYQIIAQRVLEALNIVDVPLPEVEAISA